MESKASKLVLFGNTAFAEIAYEYFTHDSPHEVVAFTVTSDYLREESLLGLPVVPFETVEEAFPPSEHAMFVAMAYHRMNRPRMTIYRQAKAKGYRLENYVSSRAFVWRNVTMGDNCFVFENNVVQPFVKLGSNVILWSGNHIGHHSTIGDHCFVASQVVVSGYCDIGAGCFLGVNATVVNNVRIGRDNLLGAGVLITRDTEDGKIYRGPAATPHRVGSLQRFGIAADEVD